MTFIIILCSIFSEQILNLVNSFYEIVIINRYSNRYFKFKYMISYFFNKKKSILIFSLSVNLDSTFCAFQCGCVFFLVGPRALFMGPASMKKNADLTLKPGLTALFIHLKFILLQCFQFSVISGIHIDPKGLAHAIHTSVCIYI